MTLPARFSLAVRWGCRFCLPPTEERRSRRRDPRSRPVEPSSLSIPLSNQEMAESIAARLRQSGLLQHYDVDIRFRDGAAELTGSVADIGQRDQVLRSGAKRARSGARGRSSERSLVLLCRCKRRRSPGAAAGAEHQSRTATPPASAPGPRRPAVRLRKRRRFSRRGSRAPPPQSAAHAALRLADLRALQQLLACGYPLAYPYNSFPFIGPIYPFPKVPLGWHRCGWNGTMASGGSARPRVAGTGGNCASINRRSARHADRFV